MVYISPATPRWIPETENDLQRAIDDDLMDETHYLELKRTLEPGRGKNKEFARDVVALSVDGGTLIFGIDEATKDVKATLNPVMLERFIERLESIARNIPDPPLEIRCKQIPAEQCPSKGYVIVEVPPSPDAPHMVDDKYYGRGEKQKQVLSDAQVRRLMFERQSRRGANAGALNAYMDRDPIPVDDRKSSHMFLVATPLMVSQGMFVDTIDSSNAGEWLQNLVNTCHTKDQIPGKLEVPLSDVNRATAREDCIALTTDSIDRSRVYTAPIWTPDDYAVEIEFTDDGELRIYHAPLSGQDKKGDLVLLLRYVPLFVRHSLSLLTAIRDDKGVTGSWSIGFGATKLDDLPAFNDTNQPGQMVQTIGPRYVSADGTGSYRRVMTFSSKDLERPGEVTKKLTHRLLQTLGAADRYLDLLTDEPSFR